LTICYCGQLKCVKGLRKREHFERVAAFPFMAGKEYIDLAKGGDLRRRLALLRAHFEGLKAEPLARLKVAFRSGEGAARDGHSKRGMRARESLKVAATEFVAGGTAGKFRKILSGAVRGFAPTVKLFDYSDFECTVAVSKSQARKFRAGEAAQDHNQVLLAAGQSVGGGYSNMRLRVKRQPAQLEMRDAMIAAMCAWDFKTAEKIAGDYKLMEPVKGDSVDEVALLIYALRGETREALRILAKRRGAYPVDFPPERKELAEGVLRKDAKLIHAGMKAINTRYGTVWAVKTYATRAKLQRHGTMGAMMPKILNHIHGHNWLVSHWAIAWVSLAGHRRVPGVFDDPGLFTQWIPWELCTAPKRPEGF